MFIGPVTRIARKIAVKKHSSTVPTRIIPMSEVKVVTILIDAMDPDLESTKKDIRKFFEPYGTQIQLLTPMKWDINFFGWFKDKFRNPGGIERNEDLFISLVSDPDYFAAEYELRCSTAKFKVSRFYLKGDVADISIYNPSSAIPRLPEAFEVIKDYLLKIE